MKISVVVGHVVVGGIMNGEVFEFFLRQGDGCWVDFHICLSTIVGLIDIPFTLLEKSGRLCDWQFATNSITTAVAAPIASLLWCNPRSRITTQNHGLLCKWYPFPCIRRLKVP